MKTLAQMVLAAGCGLLWLSGCSLLDGAPKAITAAVAELEAAVNGSGEVEALLADDFTWHPADGHKRSAGAWTRSLAKQGEVAFSVTGTKKAVDGVYVAHVTMSANGNSWRTATMWTADGDGWRLSAVRDLSAPAAAPDTPMSTAEEVARDTGEVVDYGMGATPLRQKKQLQDQIDDVQRQHGE